MSPALGKKIMFIGLWMVAGFTVAAIIGLALAFLIPWPRPVEGQVSVGMTLVYLGFTVLPFVGVGVPFILGLLGKLPGTKRDPSK